LTFAGTSLFKGICYAGAKLHENTMFLKKKTKSRWKQLFKERCYTEEGMPHRRKLRMRASGKTDTDGQAWLLHEPYT
jgi:hypothetical protein